MCPAGEWLDKLKRYTQASELVIKPNPRKSADPEVAKQAEGERILKAISLQVCCALFLTLPVYETLPCGSRMHVAMVASSHVMERMEAFVRRVT